MRRCTGLVRDAVNDMIKIALSQRSEFITPEHWFQAILFQPPFVEYCKKEKKDRLHMAADILDYTMHLDTVKGDEDYPLELSQSLLSLLHSVHNEFPDGEAATDSPITIPDIIELMYELDDSYLKYTLQTYLCSDISEIKDTLIEYYKNDIENFPPEDDGKMMEITLKAGELNDINPDELIGRLMSSAKRLMGNINKLNGAQRGVQREPWEEMVTCVNDTYKEKNPLIGRDTEIERAMRVLSRKDKNNVLFIGEPGVGKTAIIYGLAKQIEEGNAPKWLIGKKIYSLSMSTLVAGASYHGEFEKRMTMILEGAKKRGNSIIYIDEIHSISNIGGGNNSMETTDILKPYLEDGALRFIGSTTYQDFNRSLAKNKAIVRRFQQIDIKEPSTEETVRILEGLLPSYEKHHGVKYDDEAVRFAVEQSSRLIVDRFLPDKAIDILDEAGAYLQQHPLLNKKGEPKAARYQKVDKTVVSKILTEVCRIDAKTLSENNNESLKTLEKRINAEIYGQDEAIEKSVRAVMMAKAGLTEGDKPLASLLFVGPTGVGKTEVCKVLARELGVELVRFDMSEYTERHTVAKLIGSPAGYVGYEDGGLLTDAIRKTPNCVLLLDEIEKAHSDIYNILLQVMDYAKLTDNRGNKVDFKNVILIMTSNAGAQYAAQAAVGFTGGLSKGEAMMQTVKKTFKPEFLNRLSGTVVFKDMDEKMASLILDKKVTQLADRLKSKNVSFKLTNDAHAHLLKKGFTKQYGAREMDRVLQNELYPLLMQEILFGKLKKGGEIEITLDMICKE